MQKTPIKYDMHINWMLTDKCNFSCIYCCANAKKGIPKPIDIPRVMRQFNGLQKTLLITIGGGEPFLVPNFVELVQALTKKHYVRIDTNLSLKGRCEEFLNKIDPKKVIEITFSVHTLERKKHGISLRETSSLVKKFQKKGFKIIGNYVAYPPLLKRMKRDTSFFNKRGIDIFPTFFWGKYHGKNYPFNNGRISYEDKWQDSITSINPYAKIAISSSRNKPCIAGTAAFFIDHRGNVYPCPKLQKKLGTLYRKWKSFAKIIRCPMKNCPCPFNSNFAASPDTAYQIILLNRQLRKYETYSMLESLIFTWDKHQPAKKALRSLFNFFEKSLKLTQVPPLIEKLNKGREPIQEYIKLVQR